MRLTKITTGTALHLRIARGFPIIKPASGSDIPIHSGQNPVGTRPTQQPQKKRLEMLILGADCRVPHLRLNQELEEKPNRFSSPTPFSCLGCSAFGRRQRGITRARTRRDQGRRENMRNLDASGRSRTGKDEMMEGMWLGRNVCRPWAASTDLIPLTRSGWRRVRRPSVRRLAMGHGEIESLDFGDRERTERDAARE